jgi:hypothetical protein
VLAPQIKAFLEPYGSAEFRVEDGDATLEKRGLQQHLETVLQMKKNGGGPTVLVEGVERFCGASEGVDGLGLKAPWLAVKSHGDGLWHSTKLPSEAEGSLTRVV